MSTNRQTDLPFSSAVAQSLAAAASAAAANGEKSQTLPSSFDIVSLLPQDYTPGHVLAVLNQVGKGGYRTGATISEDHFRLLLNCARPDEPKDAQIIMTALINYKRINRFLLTTQLADDCVNTILKSDRTMGGLLVLDNMTLESGLYYAATIDTINTTLAHVLHESSVVDDNPTRVYQTLVNMITTKLLIRKQRPYRDMKKRAKRAYLFQSQTHDGPNERTMELVVELGMILVSNSNSNITTPTTTTTADTIITAESVYLDLVKPCLDAKVKVSQELMDTLNANRLLQSIATTTTEEEEEEHDDDDDDDEQDGDEQSSEAVENDDDDETTTSK